LFNGYVRSTMKLRQCTIINLLFFYRGSCICICLFVLFLLSTFGIYTEVCESTCTLFFFVKNRLMEVVQSTPPT
jgi:hypothetical protein